MDQVPPALAVASNARAVGPWRWQSASLHDATTWPALDGARVHNLCIAVRRLLRRPVSRGPRGCKRAAFPVPPTRRPSGAGRRGQTCWKQQGHQPRTHGRSWVCIVVRSGPRRPLGRPAREAWHLERCTKAVAPSERRWATRAGILVRSTTPAACGGCSLVSVHYSVLCPTPPTESS